MSINLFVASAGYGSRLRPVTEYLPKPLLPVAGIKVIDRMIDRVKASLDIDSIGINTHYKSEMFNDWRPATEKYFEESLLGTGGALWNAADFFKRKTCLLINGDVLTDFEWQAMLNEHRKSGNLVTLAVQDRAHERRVGVSSSNELVCIDKEMKDPRPDKWYGYACAVLYEPGFLEYLPEGESHVVPYWVEALEAGEKVGVYDIGSDKRWEDLGNVQSYVEGVLSFLNGETRFYAEMLKMPWDLQVEGFCVVEKNVAIGRDVHLENVIVLPGTTIPDKSFLKNAVVGPGFEAKFELPLKLDIREVNKIGQGGSDRVYNRIDEGVLLKYSAVEPCIERQEILTKILKESGVRVPQIHWHKKKSRELLLDDLGDETLRLWSHNKSEGEVDDLVKKSLNELIIFQKTAVPLEDRVFDQSVLLWETEYFLERFIFRICGLRNLFLEQEVEINAEREKLADSVASLPRMLMHRDFQSENIMVKGNEPWLIDFQAAHQGTPFYDAASFIGDPYMNFSPQKQSLYREYYFSLLAEQLNFTDLDFNKAYYECALQRHMQALGAYGFLSQIRGKKNFVSYMQPALLMLKNELTFLAEDYPALLNLVKEAEKVINAG